MKNFCFCNCEMTIYQTERLCGEIFFQSTIEFPQQDTLGMKLFKLLFCSQLNQIFLYGNFLSKDNVTIHEATLSYIPWWRWHSVGLIHIRTGKKLPAKRSYGVASEVNLEIPLHADGEAITLCSLIIFVQ